MVPQNPMGARWHDLFPPARTLETIED
jgi:hypothetical protein